MRKFNFGFVIVLMVSVTSFAQLGSDGQDNMRRGRARDDLNNAILTMEEIVRSSRNNKVADIERLKKTYEEAEARYKGLGGTFDKSQQARIKIRIDNVEAFYQKMKDCPPALKAASERYESLQKKGFPSNKMVSLAAIPAFMTLSPDEKLLRYQRALEQTSARNKTLKEELIAAYGKYSKSISPATLRAMGDAINSSGSASGSAGYLANYLSDQREDLAKNPNMTLREFVARTNRTVGQEKGVLEVLTEKMEAQVGYLNDELRKSANRPDVFRRTNRTLARTRANLAFLRKARIDLAGLPESTLVSAALKGGKVATDGKSFLVTSLFFDFANLSSSTASQAALKWGVSMAAKGVLGVLAGFVFSESLGASALDSDSQVAVYYNEPEKLFTDIKAQGEGHISRICEKAISDGALAEVIDGSIELIDSVPETNAANVTTPPAEVAR